MNNVVRWVAIVSVVLLTTNAWAVWNPDTDPNLKFNMNFENYTNSTHTTIDAKASKVGTVFDYNATYPDIFGETSRSGLGHDANFASMHDMSTGAGMDGTTESPNDVKLKVAPAGSTMFNLSSPSDLWQTDQRTWMFWFNVPRIEGSIIRHANMYLTDDTWKNKLWEIRLTAGGTLQFYHKDNCLRMETSVGLAELGVTTNTWHSATVVIDRSNVVETSIPTTQLSAKIFVDGLEVPIIVPSFNTNSMNVAPYDEPVWIGAGDRDFDGLLDEIRYYNRDLNAVEVSYLNQPDNTIPRAWLPIPRSSSVIIGTDLTWVSASGASAESVYFGTDVNNLVLKTGATANKRTNAEIGGPLQLNKTYYWYVRSTVGGVASNGPTWSFNTETGQALYPNPVNGSEDINNTDVNLVWQTPTAATYTVYVSTTRALVESNDISVRVANGITDPCIAHFNPSLIGSRGDTYYWKVNCTYPSAGFVAGNTWSFRTKPYELVFNTSGVTQTYADHDIPAFSCSLHEIGWTDSIVTGSLAADNVAVFNFSSGFSYDHRYDVIVIPELRSTDVNDIRFPTPLEISVTGDFYYDGRIQIAGDDVYTNSYDYSAARCGGFPGPKHNCGLDGSIFNDTGTHPANIADYWTQYNFPNSYDGRFGVMNSSSAKFVLVPTQLAKDTWGPGVPAVPPYKGGGGGGAGGIGGDSGRGFYFGVDSTGHSYGDKYVAVPLGGSAGGWGSTAGGSGGGGGIAIVATGNVTLDMNSQIRAWGGGQTYGTAYGDGAAGGGGGGGSVKVIAGGSVTNKGIINVNGGKGGNNDAKGNNTSGGGGGGRIAIFYGSSYTNTGTITANGGAKGYWVDENNIHATLAQNGQNGTIYVTNGSTKKASNPTPADGDNMVYTGHPDPCTIQLQWFSGYGGTTDEIFCDTNPNPTTSLGSVSTTRGQHSVSTTVTSGNTYYMKVVTDGSVSSDVWSFKTVNWRCRQFDGADVAPTDVNHISGPEWDSNHNCLVDIEDLDFFVNYWQDATFSAYFIDFVDLNRFAKEWMTCVNRTDGGCGDYPLPH